MKYLITKLRVVFTINFVFTFLLTANFTFANVSVTPASGGTGLDRSISCANGDPGGYATLGDIVIAENSKGDFSSSGSLILDAPYNWQFNTGSPPTIVVTGSDQRITAAFTSMTDVAITFTITVESPAKIEGLIISGIQVQAKDGNLTGATGDITPSGTATIIGLTASTNLGSLSLDPSSPLPVELTSFSAVIRDKSVNLNWVTETEVNSYGFEVQRSVRTDKWEVLGFVEGNGNSNSPKRYNFIDNKVYAGSSYSYRLKMVDSDGTYEYSKKIEVNFVVPTEINLSQNYPNPFNPSTTISFTLPESGNVSLKIFNPLGEEVATVVNGYTESGVHTFNFNAENMPSGMYIYQLNTNEKTITKKMLFLK